MIVLAHAVRVQHSWSCIGTSHHHCIVPSFAGRFARPVQSCFPPVPPSTRRTSLPCRSHLFIQAHVKPDQKPHASLDFSFPFVSEPNPARQNRISFSKIDVLSLCAILLPSALHLLERIDRNTMEAASCRMKVFTQRTERYSAR